MARTAAAAGLAGLAFELAHATLGLGGHALDGFTNSWLYNALLAGSALACLARGALVKTDRVAWLLIGAAVAFNAAGETYYTLAFGENGNPPTPSISDGLNLAYYPCVYSALVLLARRRLEGLSSSSWLDGAGAATATAAVVAAVLIEPMVHATHGSTAAIATNLAYPFGDLLLLTIVVAICGVSGWRPGRAWALLGTGLVLGAIADGIYVYQNAVGTYVVGSWLDTLWPASTIAVAFAAWQPPARERIVRLASVRVLLVPGAFAAVAVGLLVYGGIHHVATAAVALAGATMSIVVLRAALTFRENMRLLAESRREAVTDALTGLGNRRRLMLDLEREIADASVQRPLVLVMFDLNGFKAYNDSFGHMAGDVLLCHLGRNLADAVDPRGAAYRLGGDEFCVLLHTDAMAARPLIAAAATALTSRGEGFGVDAAAGRVLIPQEAASASVALRLADDRMYGQKGTRRTANARQQAHDVLLSLLRERQPELHEHIAEVGQLALAVGRRLGLQGEQLDELLRAAELHDVGKAAIPDGILEKPGPLDEREWTFMRRHTLIGERILLAAPALGPVAELIRSTHERWDGGGYPDGLAGEEIPLGSRIVGACDAFNAMTAERPYAPAKSAEEAIEELREHAGTQFDPRVVEALIEEWRRPLPESSSLDQAATAAARAAGFSPHPARSQ